MITLQRTAVFFSLLVIFFASTPVIAEPPISASTLDLYLQGKGSPLTSQGSTFVSKGKEWGVDPRLVVAIAGAETTFGEHICSDFNAWNWFFSGHCTSPFSSWGEGIGTLSKFLRIRYFKVYGATSIPLIRAKYCTSGCENWTSLVSQFYHDELGGDLNDLTYSGNSTSPGFTRISDMLTPREHHCAVRLTDGRVLIAGGWGAFRAELSSAEIYDPGTRTFALTGTMNAPRGRGISCTLLGDGRVLVAGGETSPFLYTATAEIYNPVTGTFTPVGDMTTPRAEGWKMFAVPGGALLFGGTYEGGGGTATAAVDRFNPTSASFTSVGTLAGARRDYTAQMLADGTTLLVGGVSRFDQNVSPTAELWDTPANQSVAIGQPANAPFARNWGSAILPNGNVLVVSGAGFPAEIYRTGSRSFTSVVGSPNFYAGDFANAVALANGKALLLGYGRVSGAGGRIAEIFDPATVAFSAIGSFAVPGLCDGYVSTLLEDGTVLVTGGGAPPTCDTAPLAEIFNPAGL